MRARRRLQKSISHPAAYLYREVRQVQRMAFVNSKAFIMIHQHNMYLTLIPCAIVVQGRLAPADIASFVHQVWSTSCSSAFIALFWHCFEFCQLSIPEASHRSARSRAQSLADGTCRGCSSQTSMLRTACGEGLSKMGNDRGERAYSERKLAMKIVWILGAKQVFGITQNHTAMLQSWMPPGKTSITRAAVHFPENSSPHAI